MVCYVSSVVEGVAWVSCLAGPDPIRLRVDDVDASALPRYSLRLAIAEHLQLHKIEHIEPAILPACYARNKPNDGQQSSSPAGQYDGRAAICHLSDLTLCLHSSFETRPHAHTPIRPPRLPGPLAATKPCDPSVVVVDLDLQLSLQTTALANSPVLDSPMPGRPTLEPDRSELRAPPNLLPLNPPPRQHSSHPPTAV